MAHEQLIARLEAATTEEQSALLMDAYIQVNGPKPSNIWDPGFSVWVEKWAEFTTLVDAGGFIDAALRLAPADWHLTLNGVNQAWHAALNETAFETTGFETGFSSSTTLAICIAALKARR